MKMLRIRKHGKRGGCPIHGILSLAAILLAVVFTAAHTCDACDYSSRPGEGRTDFDYEPGGPAPETILIEGTDRFDLYKVHFPDSDGRPTPSTGVDAYLYEPPGKGPGPGIIILPIQGGDYEVSIYFAEYLASKGYPCLRFERRAEWLEVSRGFDQLSDLILEYTKDIRRGLDWWISTGKILPDRVGLFGVSMGANIGAILVSLDERIRSAVLVIGGVGIADIIMTAKDEEIGAYRRAVQKERGIPAKQMRREILEALDPIETAAFTNVVDPDGILMFSAVFDKLVRWRHSTAQWEALSRPERITLPTGHYSSVLFIRYVRFKSLKYFVEHLGKPITKDTPVE